jgi:GNAT superfamily N-acetyltransferase
MPDTETNILIEPLGPQHDREAFSCGVRYIDTFLKKKCLDAHEVFKVRAYAARRAEDNMVLGYYTLSLTALKPEDTGPEEAHEKFGTWAIPFVYLGLLGVSEHVSGKGIGSALMLDAFKRTIASRRWQGRTG